MRKTNCKNGHFFDGDITPICPLCKEPEMTQEEKKGQKGFFTWFGQDKSSGAVERNDNPTKGFSDMVNGLGVGKVESTSVQLEQPVSQVSDIQTNKSEVTSSSTPVQPTPVQSVFQPQPESKTEILYPLPGATSQSSSLSNELKSIRNSEDPKTVGIYTSVSSEPVVGWIVCVKGESIGESYEIYTGQNSVGRSAGNDIMLPRENSVSREKHAFITFDPQNLDFYIQKGESSGLTYLDGRLIMSFEKLEAYSKITMGTSEFVFVPFCGERFKWSDYIQ